MKMMHSACGVTPINKKAEKTGTGRRVMTGYVQHGRGGQLTFGGSLVILMPFCNTDTGKWGEG